MRFFPPIVKFKTIRMILAIVAHYDLDLKQLDVKTVFFFCMGTWMKKFI